MTPTLDIVIVNWNAGVQLRRCLDSIETADRRGFELHRVVVVDNASSDSSADHLQPGTIPLCNIRNSENRGFAAACNQGAKGTPSSYLLFLNPDIVLTPESLSAAVGFMESKQNSKAAVCGVQLVDDQGTIAVSCSRFPKPRHFYAYILGLNYLFPGRFPDMVMREWDHHETKSVDIVMGAFLLMRRPIFETLGGFDERFFVYYEEVDFLHAVHQAGWQSYYVATAHAFHKGGGCSSRAKAMRLFYSLRSRLLYSYKHFGWISASGVALGTLLAEFFSRLVYALCRGCTAEVRDTLKGYTLLWSWLAGLVIKKHRAASAWSIDGMQEDCKLSGKREHNPVAASGDGRLKDVAAGANIPSGGR